MQRVSFTIKQNLKKFILLYFVMALLAGFTLTNETRSAHAAGVVNSCTAAGLATAMQGGGNIAFGCDGVIDVPSTFFINGSYSLDGSGHNVTLRARQLFYVLPNSTLSLHNLTLSDTGGTVFWPVLEGGAVYNNGTLITLGVTFQNNHSWIDGGAVYNNGGKVQLNINTFKTNKATGKGGAVYNNGGTVEIYGSTFDQNQSGYGGGAVASEGGSLDVSQSNFTGNKTLNGPAFGQSGEPVSNDQLSFNGGAIFSTGKLSVSLGKFESNTVMNGAGGAIFTAGSTTISDSTFKWNGALNHSIGGAVYNKSRDFTVSTSYFWANSAMSGGGLFNANQAIISKTTFNYNSADNGGAFYNDSGDQNTVRVLNSTLISNKASKQGGAIYAGFGGMTIINSTFSGNSAYASNSAGSSIYRALANGTTGIALYNTILNSPQGGQNCAGQPVGDGGSNIQFPGASCASSILSADPRLAPLNVNGGQTLTMALLAGSPAINYGNNFICTAAPMDGKDQRGLSRLTSGNCDSGAFEVQPYTAPAPGPRN